MVKSTQDIKELEKKINCGQIEEVMVQAENELSLARMILETRGLGTVAGRTAKRSVEVAIIKRRHTIITTFIFILIRKHAYNNIQL